MRKTCGYTVEIQRHACVPEYIFCTRPAATYVSSPTIPTVQTHYSTHPKLLKNNLLIAYLSTLYTGPITTTIYI